MSELAIAITTGAFTLAAAALGIIGNGYYQERVRKAEARAARDRVVSEAIASADTLLAAVRLFRTVWAVHIPRMAAAGVTLGFKTLASDAVAGHQRKRRMIQRRRPADKGTGLWSLLETLIVSAPIEVAEAIWGSSAERYLQVVVPARERLTAAVSPLRVSPDPKLAQAADDLAKAAGVLSDEASSIKRAFTRAEAAFELCLRDFRVAATRRD